MSAAVSLRRTGDTAPVLLLAEHRTASRTPPSTSTSTHPRRPAHWLQPKAWGPRTAPRGPPATGQVTRRQSIDSLPAAGRPPGGGVRKAVFELAGPDSHRAPAPSRVVRDVPPLGVEGSVEVSIFLGLTVQDLRGIADRIQLLVDDPQRTCARADRPPRPPAWWNPGWRRSTPRSMPEPAARPPGAADRAGVGPPRATPGRIDNQATTRASVRPVASPPSDTRPRGLAPPTPARHPAPRAGGPWHIFPCVYRKPRSAMHPAMRQVAQHFSNTTIPTG